LLHLHCLLDDLQHALPTLFLRGKSGEGGREGRRGEG
jgi:hypothetical protein